GAGTAADRRRTRDRARLRSARAGRPGAALAGGDGRPAAAGRAGLRVPLRLQLVRHQTVSGVGATGRRSVLQLRSYAGRSRPVAGGTGDRTRTRLPPVPRLRAAM